MCVKRQYHPVGLFINLVVENCPFLGLNNAVNEITLELLIEGLIEE